MKPASAQELKAAGVQPGWLVDRSALPGVDALRSVIEEISAGRYSPAVYFEDEKHQVPVDFHCISLRQFAFSGTIWFLQQFRLV